MVYSYIPLLLLPLPLSLSPINFVILLAFTYLLNRPCLYCSLLLIILFSTSCYWSQRCLIDFSYVSTSEGGSGYATWFVPRLETMLEAPHTNRTNETLGYLASIVADTAVAGFSEMATKLRGRDAVMNLSPGYLCSATNAFCDIFRRDWMLPCVRSRIVL